MKHAWIAALLAVSPIALIACDDGDDVEDTVEDAADDVEDAADDATD